MEKVLVAGGAGFIGSHLCDWLIGNGYSVLCVDNLITGSRENIQHLLDKKEFTFKEYDVTQPLEIQEDISVIFHLASPASPNHHSTISYHALPMETMMVNTVGTHRLLELALHHNSKFVFASSSEIYGDPEKHPQNEEYNGNVSTNGPRSIYDEAKRFGETLTSYYGREKNMDVRIARIFNTYGPRMSVKDLRMSIQFIVQALKNENITVFGDGKQTRSLCYISDLVEGLAALALREEASGEIINLGSPFEHSVYEYATIIKRLTGSQSEIIFSEDLPEDDPLKRQPDIQKAKKILGWEPKVKLEDGLVKMIEYVKTNIKSD